MPDDSRTYGSPMGTEVPGQTTRERPKASPPPTAALRAALANRYAGESRRETEAPSGGRRLKASNSDSSTRDLSASGAAQKIRDKKIADMKAIDEAS
jgi:hypothetical protein